MVQAGKSGMLESRPVGFLTRSIESPRRRLSQAAAGHISQQGDCAQSSRYRVERDPEDGFPCQDKGKAHGRPVISSHCDLSMQIRQRTSIFHT